MDKPVLVSIIVPVYNVADYLKEFIDSVLHQTYENIELILVNDGSPDNSLDICKEYERKDPRVRVFDKPNGGVSSARNVGLANVTGDAIAFGDPDDVLDLNMISTMVQTMKRDQSDAVFCGFVEWHPEQEDLTIYHRPEMRGVVNGIEAEYQCIRGMGVSYFTPVWNKMFKKEAICDEDGMIHRFSEDFSIAEDELWLAETVSKIASVSLISDPFYYWRFRESSAINTRFRKERWASALRAKSLSMDRLKGIKRFAGVYEAKIYNDIYPAVCIAYCMKEYEMQKEFEEQISPYREAFFQSDLFSDRKKFKYSILQKALACRLPKRLVLLAIDTTYVKLTRKLRKH